MSEYVSKERDQLTSVGKLSNTLLHLISLTTLFVPSWPSVFNQFTTSLHGASALGFGFYVSAQFCGSSHSRYRWVQFPLPICLRIFLSWHFKPAWSHSTWAGSQSCTWLGSWFAPSLPTAQQWLQPHRISQQGLNCNLFKKLNCAQAQMHTHTWDWLSHYKCLSLVSSFILPQVNLQPSLLQLIYKAMSIFWFGLKWLLSQFVCSK